MKSPIIFKKYLLVYVNIVLIRVSLKIESSRKTLEIKDFKLNRTKI